MVRKCKCTSCSDIQRRGSGGVQGGTGRVLGGFLEGSHCIVGFRPLFVFRISATPMFSFRESHPTKESTPPRTERKPPLRAEAGETSTPFLSALYFPLYIPFLSHPEKVLSDTASAPTRRALRKRSRSKQVQIKNKSTFWTF